MWLVQLTLFISLFKNCSGGYLYLLKFDVLQRRRLVVLATFQIQTRVLCRVNEACLLARFSRFGKNFCIFYEHFSPLLVVLSTVLIGGFFVKYPMQKLIYISKSNCEVDCIVFCLY